MTIRGWEQHLAAHSRVELPDGGAHRMTFATRTVLRQIVRDQRHGTCDRSHSEIAAAIGASRATVLRSIASLVAAGLLVSEPRYLRSGAGGRTTNLLRVIWEHAYWRSAKRSAAAGGVG